MQMSLLSFCRCLIALAAIGVLTPAQADWYESTGSAPIIGHDEAKARARAVEDALRQSLDFAGGRVTSVERVVDGVLKGSHFEWTAEGAIEQAHMVSERRSGNRLQVTVRANIRQTNSRCAAADFRKGVTVLPFEFAHSEQARHGELWELERAASQRFAELLGRHSRSLFLEHRIDRKVGLVTMRGAANEQDMAGFARRMGKETDAQYLVGAVFDDISTVQAGRNLTFWTYPDFKRNIGLTLLLFDTSSGELLSRASVREQAPWHFDYQASVDPYSQQFWQSQYGDTLERSMRDLVNGIDDQLACEAPRGQVVQVNGSDITVNLGDKHGMQHGQTLQIYHRGNFIDDQGIYREQWVISPYQLDITQVQRSSALGRVSNNQVGSNIQVNDRVTLR